MAKAKTPKKTVAGTPDRVVKRRPKRLIQLNPDGTPRHLPGATAQDVAEMTQPPKRKTR